MIRISYMLLVGSLLMLTGCESIRLPRTPSLPSALNPAKLSSLTPGLPGGKESFEKASQNGLLRLSMDEDQGAPNNPDFMLYILSDKTATDAFEVPLIKDLSYPLHGNLAIWRNGKRIWDLDPSYKERKKGLLTASTTITIPPGTGQFMSFSPSDLFPKDESDAVIMLPPRPTDSNNPFATAGTYRLIFELLDPSDASRRLQSNPVDFTIN